MTCLYGLARTSRQTCSSALDCSSCLNVASSLWQIRAGTNQPHNWGGPCKCGTRRIKLFHKSRISSQLTPKFHCASCPPRFAAGQYFAFACQLGTRFLALFLWIFVWAERYRSHFSANAFPCLWLIGDVDDRNRLYAAETTVSVKLLAAYVTIITDASDIAETRGPRSNQGPRRRRHIRNAIGAFWYSRELHLAALLLQDPNDLG
jgi:hypothetical protein